MEDYIKDRLEDYIQNEIDYLKREEEISGFDRDRFRNLLMLETLNNKEKEDIVDKIMGDNDLEQTLNEVTHYYLYHR